MEAGPIVAIVVSVLGASMTVAAVLVRLGRRDAVIDSSIESAARKAKHDAIDEVSRAIIKLDEEKVGRERYEADRDADLRRLEVLERQLGLDGTGPHRRD